MRILIFAADKEISEQLGSIILEKYPASFIETVDDLRNLKSIHNKSFDVVFVDDGFENNTISSTLFIQKLFPESSTVFLSDSVEAVSELLLNTRVFGIVSKRLYPSKIYRYLESVMDNNNRLSGKFSFYERGRKRNILFSNIVYVESNREKIIIKTINSEFGIWKKISDVEHQFPNFFVRCHNSFLVNMKYIAKYKSNSFVLIDGSEIVISRSKKEEAVKKFCEYKDSIR